MNYYAELEKMKQAYSIYIPTDYNKQDRSKRLSHWRNVSLLIHGFRSDHFFSLLKSQNWK